MTELSPSNDINLYLAELNAELAVGLRSRSRILEEVGDHLEAAALAERDALMSAAEREHGSTQSADAVSGGPAGDEALWVEAQRRAIAAFGTPQQIAAGFETGLVGALEKHLAGVNARVDRLLARPLVWAAAGALSLIALAAALAGLGALLEAPNALLALAFGLSGALAFGTRLARVVRGELPAGGATALRGLPSRQGAIAGFVYPELPFAFFVGYLVMARPLDFLKWVALWLGISVLCGLATRTAARLTGRAAREAGVGCDPDANWSRYLRGLWASAAISLALILSAPGPLGLKLGAGAMLLAVTATTALARRLAWDSSVKRGWGRMYEVQAGGERWRPRT